MSRRRERRRPAEVDLVVASSKLGISGVVCLTLVAAFALPVFAQTSSPSLAAVADREKQRRAGIDQESKVYTNDDLRGGLRLTTGRATAVSEPDSAPPSEGVTSESNDPQAAPDTDAPERDEGYWRDRITSARDDMRRAELMAAALQNRVDGLWAEFTAHDDPVQRSEIGQNRNDALHELQRTEAEVDRLSQEILDIQEEARRSGIPPGLLR